jgi:hypothetical protein
MNPQMPDRMGGPMHMHAKQPHGVPNKNLVPQKKPPMAQTQPPRMDKQLSMPIRKDRNASSKMSSNKKPREIQTVKIMIV